MATRSESQTISLRVPRQRRELIDRAARASGKNRTEFILDSATREAEDVLLDRRLFQLDPVRYAAFERALDAPPRSSPALRRLLAGTAPWER